MSYPSVLNEAATLELVLAGKSLARYGDGEWNMCRGHSIKSQTTDPELCRRLRAILSDSGECLVGLPNVVPESPKYEYWLKQIRRQEGLLNTLLTDRPYVSSFVSRADSAPWINCNEYWSRVPDLWMGRDITLVRGSGKTFTPELMMGAKTVTEIIGPRQNAWFAYDELMERIGTPERVLLSLGPAATVMAVDLCAKGVHAIDVGHMGCYMRKWLKAPELEA